MTKQLIIGLAGRANSGKTTAAKHLVFTMGFTRLSFASPIKSMVGDFLLGMGYGADYVDSLLTVEKEQVLAPLGKSPRQLMQSIGTEWGRDCIDNNIWVTFAQRRLRAGGEWLIVFDDVRFENEASMICRLGGHIIHIDRGELVTDAHRSESGIMGRDCDFFVDNDYTVDDLCRDVLKIARDLVRV